ncbi:peptidase inhibitor family I36 protein [Streptomyces sp. MAR4 CNX-425]|uniref:peptidase inhibitor family I36 protein n=1 Tax=Streptomyces sp. MAR4 CNX-425 TaxID=3406343 RepID=UPI003B50B124
MRSTSRSSARTGDGADRTGRGRLLRLLALVGVVPVLLAGALTPATADSGGSAGTGTDTGLRLAPETGGVLAEYDGRTIDLSLGWDGAETCVEQDDGGFVCYDDDNAHRAAQGLEPRDEAGPLAGAASCGNGYFCLWDNQYFQGRKVQFLRAKTFYLDRLGFRNQANSMYNNRRLHWATYMFDVDCGCAMIPYGTVATPVMSHMTYRPSGTWNNKIDKIRLHNDDFPPPSGFPGGGWVPPPRPRLDAQEDAREDSRGALAEYEGRTIDLSLGWEGADTCVEQDDGGFVCHDDDNAGGAAAGTERAASPQEAGTFGVGECAKGYFCLWDASDFGGRKVQFKKAGHHDLRDVGFRNRANALYNARSSDTYFDDGGEGIGIEARFATPALSRVPHFDADRTWNNKIDSVDLLPQ